MARYNDTDISQIPEVQDFIKTQAELDQLKLKHPEVFQTLAELQEEYNQRLDAAHKACRARGASCGPFEFYQQAESIDVDGLYDALGRNSFLAAGGEIKTITTKSIDKTKAKAAAQRGVIPPETLEAHTKIQQRYHKPSKIELP